MVLLSQNVAILDKLLAAHTAQSEALRALKNETVGHVLKKEKWVELGVLRPVVRVLLRERPPSWQIRGGGGGGGSSARSRQIASSSVSPPDDLAPDDLAHLQALELVGIFASGGPSFLAPLHAAGALPAVLDYIDPDANHPRLVYAALRTLATVIKTTRLVSESPLAPSPVTLKSLADAVLAPAHLPALYAVIAAEPRAWWSESITNTAISIISALCRSNDDADAAAATDNTARHRAALAQAGILNALATKMASYVVLRGQVVPGADVVAEKEGLRDAIPGPATPLLDVAGVFDAVAAILGDSRLRACMLLSAPSILAIFPQLEFESAASDVHAAWKALSMGGLGGQDQSAGATAATVAAAAAGSSSSSSASLGALDYLLPAVPTPPPPGQARMGFFPATEGQSSDAYLSAMASTFMKQATALHQQRRMHTARAAAGAAGAGAAGTAGVGAATSSSSSSSAAADAAGGGGGGGVASGELVEDAESPMVPWLVYMVRSTSGLERLTAASVLTCIYKAGFATKPSRESAMAVLIIPLLLQMLDAASKGGSSGSGSGSGSGGYDDDERSPATQQAITETAITVLARLVANSAVLQKAAVEGKAIKILAQLLRESYEPVSVHANPRPWNPTPTTTRTGTPAAAAGSSRADDKMEEEEEEAAEDGTTSYDYGYDYDHPYMLQRSSTLGPAGQSALLAHRIRLREAVLKALTALVAIKYEYQKALVDQQDVMMYVVASLCASPTKPRSSPSADAEAGLREAAAAADPEYGRNPAGVLVAACNCVRMLSRSMAIQRTTLEDAGISAPMFRLLQHPDVEVQTAATAAICNLVTETSPMRERFIRAGIIAELCRHAHSQHSALRLNALWALKHLVDGVGPSLKKSCLEQLGSGWLLRLIDSNSETAAATGAAATTTTTTAAANSFYARTGGNFPVMPSGSFGVHQPRAVSSDRMDEDVAMGQSDGDENEDSEDSEDSADSPALQRARFPQTSHERSRTGRLRQAEARLAALRELEPSAQRRAAHDDMLTQEQGLNLIRNLIGPGCAPASSSSSSAAPAPAPAATSSSSLSRRLPAAVRSSPASDPASADASAAGVAARDPANEATEMIDYLFNELGQDRFFAALLSRVQPRLRMTRRTARTASTTSTTATTTTTPPEAVRMQPPRAKVVEAVVYILVHIAAGVSRHRQIVVAQTELMRAVLGHFGSRDQGVRVALCHLVTNLTWHDSAADAAAAAQRAVELKKLGAEMHLERLRFDPDMDVRERAKMAAHQMGLDVGRESVHL